MARSTPALPQTWKSALPCTRADTGRSTLARTRLVAVVYREQCSDKGAALRREAAIKKLPRAKKLELTEENCDA